MIAYRKTNGRAHDLRLVPDEHQAEDGEILLPGWELPDIATLHDPLSEDAAHNAEVDRKIEALEARITKRMMIDAAAGTPYSGYTKIIEEIATLRSTRRK